MEERGFFDDTIDDIYDTTFDSHYESLVAQYKAGELTEELLENNIKESHIMYMNAFYEGETKSAYNTAVIDAAQYVLALIRQGKI